MGGAVLKLRGHSTAGWPYSIELQHTERLDSIPDFLQRKRRPDGSSASPEQQAAVVASPWPERLQAAWKTAQEAYEVECRKKRPGKATNTKALVARSDAAVAAFEGLGIPGAVAREAVKRGSGAVAYLLVHGELDV